MATKQILTAMNLPTEVPELHPTRPPPCAPGVAGGEDRAGDDLGATPPSRLVTSWGDGQNQLPLVLVEDMAKALIAGIDVPGLKGDPYGHLRPAHIAPAAKEALAYQASIAA